MERQLNYLQALREGLLQEMRRNSSVVVLGEDVCHGLRGITKGCLEEFGPLRIWDTPISEAAFVGLGTGAALAGLRPVIEFQISTIIYVALDQLANQAQKLRYMTGGQGKIPVTYIIPGSGARPGLAGQHSDHLYAMLAHCGFKVVIPSTAYDAKGLLTTAIREDDPVVVFAPSAVMGSRCAVPEEEVLVPLGRGEIRRAGHDVTVVAVAPLLADCLKVADLMAKEGISVEVLDPRSIVPFDHAIVKHSVAKTGRLVIFDDSNRTCGFAAEVAAYVAENAFETLKAPIIRITRADVPVPFSIALDKHVLPRGEQLEQAIRRTLGHEQAIRSADAAMQGGN
jgi:acetoin:2,6-dichlorophenolindophenol oxidoreductase subunit beta